MKTRVLIFVWCLTAILSIGSAKPVNSEQALQIAHQYLSAQLQQEMRHPRAEKEKDSDIRSREIENLRNLLLKPFESQADVHPSFHVISDKTGGFVIVAGDDRAIPILAQSTNGHFDQDNLPPSLVYWLESYDDQIKKMVASGAEQDPSIAALWNDITSGSAPSLTRNPRSVSTLMTTTWDQSPYYNNHCPYDNYHEALAVTGCVATAMAQIMNYWQYPNHGYGTSRFVHENYGELSVDHENTTFNWAQMSNALNSSSSSAQVDAVAVLMYHCGVSVHMNYGVRSSGVSDITKVVKALEEKFNYPGTASLIKRDKTTDSIWYSSLKNELDHERPVFYVGFKPETSGGHAWVCDGYNNSDQFHMNWGWGGSADGYYALNALQPGSSNYNRYQMAVIGISPLEANPQKARLKLYNSLSVSPTSLEAGDALRVEGNVANDSNKTFAGIISAGIFDSDNNLLQTLGSYEESGLEPNYHYTSHLVFDRGDTSDLKPGTYYVSLIYQHKNTTSWIKASDVDYSNRIELTIEGAETSDGLSLYAPLTIGSNNIIIQNAAYDLSFNIINRGSNTYNGAVEVDFYDLNGDHRSEIGDIYHYDVNGLEQDYYYRQDRSDTIENGTDLPPGDYLLAVTHFPTNGSEWLLVGSGEYENPIRVTVQEGPDRYEPNDDDFAYLYPQFSNGQARVTTQNANIHREGDFDMYLISLPKGKDYIIDARVHDSYYASNNQNYTTDVYWILATEAIAQVYDDIMPDPQRLQNGGLMGFGVAGWGANVGTYQLDISIKEVNLGQPDSNDPRTFSTPLYRFYRAGNDSHFFTASEDEKNMIIQTQPANFWVFEGESQKVLSAQTSGAVPVYRMFNSLSKSHFYTSSPEELAAIQQNLGHIFSLEGIAFYVLPTQVPGSLPVYRFFSTQTASHFFTISEAEKDQIIATIPESKLRFEGVAWYAFP